MRVINLASGSDGNMTYIECDGGKIILDIGLSCRAAEGRLKLLGVDPNEISAILVTHAHSDHIKGVDNFATKYNKPVYAHESVWNEMEDKIKTVSSSNRKNFEGMFDLAGFTINPVEVPHDAKCFAFSFENNGKKVSVLTDLGHFNEKIFNTIAGSNLVYLESNYDKQMLTNGRYPLSLKRRISGKNGHLSNDSSSQVALFLAQTGTRQIVLSHLSKENNTPDLAYEYVSAKLYEQGIEEGVDIRIDVASPNPGVMFRLK